MDTIAISALPGPQSIYNGLEEITSISANTAWDWKTQQNAILNMTENTTLQNPTNLKAGAEAGLFIVQNASVAKELYYDSAYQPSDDLPLITTALNSVCYIKFKSLDGVNAICINFQQNRVV